MKPVKIKIDRPNKIKAWDNGSLEADIYGAIAAGLTNVKTDVSIVKEITLATENVIHRLKIKGLIQS